MLAFRHGVRRLVQSPAFGMAVGLMVIMNCIMVGVEVEMFAQDHLADTPAYIAAVNLMIFVCFALELVLRLIAEGFVNLGLRARHVAVIDKLRVFMTRPRERDPTGGTQVSPT